MNRKEFISKTALGVSALGLINCANTLDERDEKEYILPPKLKQGDTVALFAPAGAVFNKKHIAKSALVLKNLGYKVHYAKSLYTQEGYFSNTDKLRTEELHNLLQNKNIKALIAMRGGWGCARMLPLLNLDLVKENPKIIMGYSDLSSLLNYISTKTQLVTYHGIMGYSTWNAFALSQFKEQLVKPENTVVLKNPNVDLKDLKTWHNGTSKGELFGGNLSVVCTQIGTKYDINWNNKILFLEETNEEPYRIDRMLYQLKHTGVFDKINGLVLGKFNKCMPEDASKSFSLEEVFSQYFTNFNKPMYAGASFGHVVNKFILPVGQKVELNATEQHIIIP